MRKRAFMAAVALLLVAFTVSGCGRHDRNMPTDPPPNTESHPQQEEETTAPKSETPTEPATELPEPSKEEAPMQESQFYMTANGTTFAADFADNDSADAFRDLLQEGDLTIHMSDYGSFEKVGSIGTTLPRKDTQISTTTGDVMLYQGDQIVIFYGTNSWSYSRLGKIEGATAEDLLSALGSGDVVMTFSLKDPQRTKDERSGNP